MKLPIRADRCSNQLARCAMPDSEFTRYTAPQMCPSASSRGTALMPRQWCAALGLRLRTKLSRWPGSGWSPLMTCGGGVMMGGDRGGSQGEQQPGEVSCAGWQHQTAAAGGCQGSRVGASSGGLHAPSPGRPVSGTAWCRGWRTACRRGRVWRWGCSHPGATGRYQIRGAGRLQEGGDEWGEMDEWWAR